jgi:hypothetical protein
VCSRGDRPVTPTAPKMNKKMDIDRILASAPVYYHGYIREAGTAPLLESMEAQIGQAKDFFGRQFWEKRNFRYAEGKWTPTEVLGHLTDAERIFQYRALRFARNDKTELAGFEENDYIANTDFNARGVESLLDEFDHVRRSGIALYRSLTEDEKWRSGIANDNSISVNALFYANVGHFNHHVKVVAERY